VGNREGSSPSPDTISENLLAQLMKIISRAEWPHTIDDIRKSLDGVWGLVGAQGVNGNLFRLEKSLKEPVDYKLTEYQGTNDEQVLAVRRYDGAQKEQAIQDFATHLGFSSGSE